MVYKCIYRITNEINGKIYIGQTNNLHRRIAKYKELSSKPHEYFVEKNYTVQSSNQVIIKAMRKYGFVNFKFEILAQNLTYSQANILEKDFIRIYKSQDNNIGYNKTGGGIGHYNIDEKIKNSIKIKLKARKLSKEHKAKLSANFDDPEYKEKHAQLSRHKMSKSSSKYTGVHYCNAKKRWIARLFINDKFIYIGSSKEEIVAAEKVNTYIAENKLDFIKLNEVHKRSQ